jgi:hypothetical protein
MASSSISPAALEAPDSVSSDEAALSAHQQHPASNDPSLKIPQLVNEPTLLGLPTELQLQIIGYLPTTSITRLRLRDTCSTFRRLIPKPITPRVFGTRCNYERFKNTTFNVDLEFKSRSVCWTLHLLQCLQEGVRSRALGRLEGPICDLHDSR